MLAASVAAALVLLGGAAYGAIAALPPGTRPGPALTAVSECAGTELANGTLEQINGTSLVIGTASGQPVTVTTSASAGVSVAGALLSDITDGAPVIALGPSSGGTIAATSVTVGPPPGNGEGHLTVTPPPGAGSLSRGTVSDASTAGFTVVTSGGARVPVITSGDTFVVVPHASLGQLQAGTPTVAVGHAGPHRTLSARLGPAAAARGAVQGAVQRDGTRLLARLARRRAQPRRWSPAADPPDPMMAGTAAHAVQPMHVTDRERYAHASTSGG